MAYRQGYHGKIMHADHSNGTPAELGGSPVVLTVPETARLLRVSERHVRTLVARGDLPIIRLGRSVRVSNAELQQWLRARSIASMR